MRNRPPFVDILERFERLSMKDAIVRYWPEGSAGPQIEDLAEPKAVFGWIEVYNGWAKSSGREPMPFDGGRAPGLAEGGAVYHLHDAHIVDIRLPAGVEPFRLTDRLSDSDRATLMGGTLQRVYDWSPQKT